MRKRGKRVEKAVCVSRDTPPSDVREKRRGISNDGIEKIESDSVGHMR